VNRSDTPSGHRILILRPHLDVGGVETRFLTFAEALSAQGGEVTLLAGPGPLEERAKACASVRPVDFARIGDRDLHALVTEAAAGHTGAMLAAEPMLMRAVPHLAAKLPVVLGLHGRGDRNRLGFGLVGGRRLPEAVAAMAGSGRVALVAAAEAQAEAQARLLGLPAEAVAVSPNAVPSPGGPAAAAHGPVRSLVVLCRLAPDKLHNVAAAIELTAAGRSAGRDVVLHVHGDGAVAPLVRRMLSRRLPRGAWEMHGRTDSSSAVLAGADAVVGTGRAAVEALMLGRRVVPAKTVPDRAGLLGPVITPETFDAAARENFSWRSLAPVPAAEVWAGLERVGEDAVAAVCERARRELQPASMVERELALLDALGPMTPAAARALADADRLLARPFGGARRLPRGLNLPDRAVLQLRDQRRLEW
jgi:hypothetical protein